MEAYPQFVTELRFEILTEDERSTLEEFVLIGKAAEVPIPRPGETMRSMAKGDAVDLRIIHSKLESYELIRRSNPWVWKSRYKIQARIDTRHY